MGDTAIASFATKDIDSPFMRGPSRRRRIEAQLAQRFVGRRRLLVVAAVALIGAVGLVGTSALHRSPIAAGVQAAPPVQYYVALGDSIAAGVGASTAANDYVNVVYQHELVSHPGLQLVNLACSGATTGSVINGPGCSYTTGTQLGDAEAFLRAHPGQVAMLTIDIGANDVDGCLGSSGVQTSCVQAGFNQISSNLPLILSGLRAADPTLAIYGMDYYDPFLNQWLTGARAKPWLKLLR